MQPTDNAMQRDLQDSWARSTMAVVPGCPQPDPDGERHHHTAEATSTNLASGTTGGFGWHQLRSGWPLRSASPACSPPSQAGRLASTPSLLHPAHPAADHQHPHEQLPPHPGTRRERPTGCLALRRCACARRTAVGSPADRRGDAVGAQRDAEDGSDDPQDRHHRPHLPRRCPEPRDVDTRTGRTSLTQERRCQHGRRPPRQWAIWRRSVRHPGRSIWEAVVVPADPRHHRPVPRACCSGEEASTRPTAETAGPRTAPWRSWQRRRRPARCAGSRRASPSTTRRAHLAAGRATCSGSCGAGSGSWSSRAPASCRSWTAQPATPSGAGRPDPLGGGILVEGDDSETPRVR